MNSDGLLDAVSYVVRKSGQNDFVRTYYMGISKEAPYGESPYYFKDPVDINSAAGATNGTHRLHGYEGQVGDFNGDGKLDVVYQHTSIEKRGSYSSYTRNYRAKSTIYFTLGDIDVDGADNVFDSVYLGAKDSIGVVPDMAKIPEAKELLSLRVADINGDGYSDIVAAGLVQSTNTVQWYYRFSNGLKFVEPVYFLDTNLSLAAFNKIKRSYQPALLDANGDGYPDFIWRNASESKINVNYWQVAQNTFQKFSSVFSSSPRNSVKDSYEILDVNGDQTLDIAYFNAEGWQYLSVYLNKNTNPLKPVLTKIVDGNGVETNINYSAGTGSAHYLYRDIAGSQAGCTNKSGGVFRSLCDLIYTRGDSFYRNLYTRSIFQVAPGDHSFGLDGNRDGTPDPVFLMNSPGNVVTSVASSAPAEIRPGLVSPSATSKVSYYYADAKFQAMGRGGLGFGAVISRDEQSRVVTVSQYRQDYPFVGRPLKTEVRSNYHHVLKTSINSWRLHQWDGRSNSGTAIYSRRYFQPYLSTSVDGYFQLVGNGSQAGQALKTVTTVTSPDTQGYGNTPSVRTDTLSINGDNSVSTFSTLTENTFGYSSYDKRYGRLKSAKVTHTRNGTPAIVRNSAFSYYARGESGGAEGMLKTETIEPGTAFEHSTHYSYDRFGNKVKTREVAADPRNPTAKLSRCNVNTREYDPTGRYLHITRDCLGRKLTEVKKRNRYGSPEVIHHYTNAAGTSYVETRQAYTLGNVRYFKTDDTGAFEATTLWRCTSNTNCPAGAKSVTSQWGPGNGSGKVELAREYIDVLGRPMRKLRRGLDGKWIYQDIHYDSLGRLKSTSLPYYEGDSPVGWTTHYYDLLGRITRTRRPDGAWHFTSYIGFLTQHTNPKGQIKIETHNALGELVSVQDHQGTSVSYSYDAQGNLATTRHDNGTPGNEADDSVIRISYDRLGRKTAMSDPDKGNWSYQYNAFGELATQTDAKGQTITQSYDGLGRMVSRQDRLANGQLRGNANWVYDGVNGLGQLDHVADSASGYVKVVEYDNLGRPSKTLTSLGVNGQFGNHYEKVTYDQYGRTYQVFDAARNDDSYTENGVEHRYNAFGYQHQLVDAVYSGGAPRSIYRTITSMDARGKITSETLGSGVVSRSRSYHPYTGRLMALRASTSSKVVQNLEHQWDTVGNLTAVIDRGTGAATTPGNRSTEYRYDTLNRLTFSELQQGNTVLKTETMAYQANGNIASKTGIGSYRYAQRPHAVTQAGSTTYQYDANGNMTGDSRGRSLSYTVFDKAQDISLGSQRVHFDYDTSRKRYLRRDTDSRGTQTTLYIGSVEKITHSDGRKEWRRYIGGDVMILQSLSSAGNITRSDPRYLLKDHLGSLQYTLDSAGLVVQSLGFGSWGDRLNARQHEGSKPWATNLYHILETPMGFTGHEMVDGLDIVHMNGRIYDNKLGRFLQADIIIDGANNTQGYNRYSYVHNNPLNATDPSGFNAFTELFDDILGVSESPVLNSVVQVVGCYVANAVGACPAFLAAYNASYTYGMTGDIGSAIQSGVIAGISAQAFAAIGEYYSSVSGTGSGQLYSFGGNELTIPQIIGQVGAHGFTGGVTASLQGGNFGHGFASASFTKGVMGGAGFDYSDVSAAAVVGRTTVAFVVGGTASSLSGGKFANGAATAAFAHVLNGEGGAQEVFEQAIDFWRGMVHGTGSVFVGTGRSVRQVARSTGLMGMDELRETMANGEQLDKALQVISKYPEESASIAKVVIRYKVTHANAYDTGTMVGRVATGFVLAPMGALAGLGDVLTGVENYGANMEIVADFLLYGRPSSSEYNIVIVK